METGKWVSTAASIWIQCFSGLSYTFGIYSPLLKSSQGYDQSTLDTVSVLKDIGANAGVLSGLLYSAVPSAPWVVHLIGAVQCFVGYLFIWLAVTGAVYRPPVPIVCFFMFVAAHSQTFFNTANVVTAVQNYPEYGGTIIGIMKGFLGLSGPVIIQIYQTLFQGNPRAFLLMIALFPTLLIVLLMTLVRTYQITAGGDKKYLNAFSAVSLTIAAYLMIIIILGNIFAFPFWAHVLATFILVLLLCSPFSIAIKAQQEDSLRQSNAQTISSDPLIDKDGNDKLFSRTEDPAEAYEDCGDSSQEGEEMNLLQAMSTLNFWLLFIAMICGMGSGLATINNIGQMGESLNYTHRETATLVSLWGIWNFLGRFGAGYVSDILLHRRGWARPLLMTLTLATMTCGHLIIASGYPGNLYVGSVLVGVCYGSQWSLMPTITCEIFGVLHMGTIFNTIAIASPVGSYIFSVRVIGYIYDKQAGGEMNSCYGTHCFMLSFLVMAVVSLVGLLAALILFIRTRRFYASVVLRRFRQSTRL